MQRTKFCFMQQPGRCIRYATTGLLHTICNDPVVAICNNPVRAYSNDRVVAYRMQQPGCCIWERPSCCINSVCFLLCNKPNLFYARTRSFLYARTGLLHMICTNPVRAYMQGGEGVAYNSNDELCTNTSKCLKLII